jgi:hypothetical protein
MAQPQINSSVLAKQVEQQNAGTDATIKAVTDSYREIQNIGSVRAEAVQAAGDAEAIVTGAAEVGKLRTQEHILKGATVLGTNLDDASELITSLGMETRQKYEAAKQARENYFAKKSGSFVDDPLGWIEGNLLGGNQKAIDEYNKQALDYNAASERLDGIISQTTAFANSQNAIVQTRTAASVEAATRAVSLKAAEQAAQVRQQNLLYNVQGLEVVQKMDAQKLERSFHLNQAVMSEKHLAIAQAQLAESMKQHKLALEERTERLEQKKADRAELQSFGDTVNAGRRSMGFEEIPAAKAYQMMRMQGEVGQIISHQYVTGAVNETLGKPFISDNPADAAKVIIQSNAPLAPGMKPVKDFITTVYRDVASGKDKKIDLKDPRQILSAANKIIGETTKNMAADIKYGDNTNIYQSPDLANLSSIPAVSDSALFKNVLAPLVTTGALKETNPEQILSLAVSAVAKKQISMNDAIIGTSTLFRAATELNNTTKDYFRVGVMPQSTYNTTLPTSYLGGKSKVDMTNQLEISNVISKKLYEVRGGFR